jgi:hypothetical protein
MLSSHAEWADQTYSGSISPELSHEHAAGCVTDGVWGQRNPKGYPRGCRHLLKRKDGGYSLSRPTLIRFLRSSDMSTWQVAWQVTWQVVWQVAWHIEDGVRGRGSQNNPKDIFVICSEDHNISNKISKCRSQATTSFLRRSMTTSS